MSSVQRRTAGAQAEDGEYRVEVVGTDSPMLSQAWDMYRRYSSTLGFFPRGAMDAAAVSGGIYAAIKGEDIAGYLLFRLARREAVIVHLCVAEAFRGHGIADGLVARLKEDTRDIAGIRLSCREDYEEANRLWRRLGFVAEGSRLGRGGGGRFLVTWRYDRAGQPPLLAQIREARLAGRRKAVLDANVFFDLGPEGGPGSDESKALLADWIEDEVALCVTPELRNEVRRRRDHAACQAELLRYSTFPELGGTGDALDQVLGKVKALLPPARKDQDEADRRQLSHAVAGGADYLVTRDYGLLAHAETVHRALGTRVIRPMDLVLTLDEEQRDGSYEPVRIGGTPLPDARVRAEDRDQVQEAFQRFSRSEPKAAWRARSDVVFARPDRCEPRWVRTREGQPLVFYALDRSEEGVLGLPVLRATGDSLAPTLLRRVLVEVADIARRERRPLVRCSDGGPPEIEEALLDAGFLDLPDGSRVRAVLACCCSERQDLLGLLRRLPPPAGEVLAGLAESLPAERLERLFWPLKMIGAEIPSYIIPIQPHWAQHLFDVSLAEQDLFGAKLGPALGLENAYFRAARPKVIGTTPARILWYVSGKGHRQGVQALRACSLLDEVTVGAARDLFRRFRRMGIYEWRNVLDAAKGDPYGEIMGLHFSHTQRLDRPVPWSVVQSILARHKGKNPLQSPIRISEPCFIELYLSGTGQDEAA